MSSQLPKKATLPKPRKNNLKGRTRHHKKSYVESSKALGSVSNTKESNFLKAYEEQHKRKSSPLQKEALDPVSVTKQRNFPETSKKQRKRKNTYHKKRFYEGHITLFDHSEKKHMVIYEDGDQEMLNLTKERWELVEHDYASVHTPVVHISSIYPSPIVVKADNGETKSEQYSTQSITIFYTYFAQSVMCH
ncbi:hypothetical protein RND71_012647 [Anisodus tanguticus]|uniref:Uncharacterized protein n=1 Tax=Anisodus tanguticus TaxID=243964 RepID=A0AAE1SFK7_9SOLA|nr:hypothetical protein RND71_012647 [Anisodus tanguticus]